LPNLDTWKCEEVFTPKLVSQALQNSCMNKTSCTVDTKKFIDSSKGPKE